MVLSEAEIQNGTPESAHTLKDPGRLFSRCFTAPTSFSLI